MTQTIVPSAAELREQNMLRARDTFIAAIRDGKTVSQACLLAGRTTAWAYPLRNNDPDFAQRWYDAAIEGNENKADRYEEHLAHLAEDAKTEPVQLTATIVGLKMTKRFLEQPTVAVQVNNAPADPVIREMYAALEREARRRLQDASAVTQSAVPQLASGDDTDASPSSG